MIVIIVIVVIIVIIVDCSLLCFALDALHVQTLMLTDVQTPFLGTPVVSLTSCFVTLDASKRGKPHSFCQLEGGMLRLETLIELNFISSSFLSLSSY